MVTMRAVVHYRPSYVIQRALYAESTVQIVIKRCHLAHIFLRQIRMYLDVEPPQILLQGRTRLFKYTEISKKKTDFLAAIFKNGVQLGSVGTSVVAPHLDSF